MTHSSGRRDSALQALESRQLLSGEPLITGTLADQSVPDNSTILPFAPVTISDIDSPTVSVEVLLDNSIRGVFTPASLSASGFADAGSGRYTYSGSPAAATAAIRLLSYDPTDNRLPVGLSDTTAFTITADDGATTPASDSATTVHAISANDPSALGGFTTSTTIDDTATATPFASVTITDPDPLQSLTVTVTLDDAAKGVFTPASLSASGFVLSGSSYTFTGLAGAAQAAIRALAFDPTNNRVAVGAAEATAFTVAVNDGFGTQSDATTTVTSASVNDAPTIGGAVAGQAVLDTATVSPFSAVTIGDVDPGQTLTATVTLDDAAKGAFTAPSLSASGFADAGGGVYTRTGTAAALTTAIRALVFAPSQNRVPAGNTETTTLAIGVNDAIAPVVSDSTTTVVSTSVNVAPAIGGAAAGQAVLDNATVQPFTAVTLADADNDTLSISVTIDSAAKGAFTGPSLSASGFVNAGGGMYTFSGTAAAAQTAIRQLVFAPTENRVMVGSTETSTFTISADDAIAPAVTNAATTVISTPFNNPTAITGIVSGQAVNDNATVMPFLTVTIADADSPAQSLNLFIVIDAYAKGAFTGASVSAGGFSDFGNGTYSRVGTAAQLTAAIRALVFNPTNDRVVVGATETTTFTVVTTDNVAAFAYSADTTVVSTSVNDAPVLSGTTAGQAVNDNATVAPFAGVTLTDPDVSQTQSVTITLDDAAKGAFTSASLAASGFADAGGGVYTFSGSATAATTAIRALVYDPANNRVAVGATETTTFTIAANDGNSGSGSDSTTTIISTSINDAPAIAGSAAAQAVNDNATLLPFASSTIADPDAPSQTITVTVTLDAAAKGAFTGDSLTASGFVDSGGGIYSFTGTASAATTAIRQLVFAPTENRVVVGTSETTTFTVGASDGVAPLVTDNTTTVVSTPFNDVTIITGSVAAQATDDTGTLSPFAAVTVSDADSPAQTMTASVTLDTAAKGSFTGASLTASGFAAAGGGVYTFSGTAAAITTAIRQLVFRPTANRVAVGSTETTTFTIAVDDTFSPAVTDSATTVVSTSINDVPAITGTLASQAVNDNAMLLPFAGVTITDADPAQTPTVTITLDTAAKGVFTSASLASSGFSDAGGGIYTFTGTAAQATTAIRLLSFNPSDNRVAANATETSTFTIAVNDGVAAPVSDSTTTVISTNVNDAPSITGVAADQPVLDNATVSPFTGVTIADADPGTTISLSVSLDDSDKGAFTGDSLTASGFADAGGGVYTFTGTPGAATTAIRQLVFRPAENRVVVGSTETTTFTIAAADGVGAPTHNTATTVISTPFNDVTTITGTFAGQTTLDSDTLMPFAGVTIADADSPAQTLSVAVSLDNAAKGTFTPASLAASGFTDAGGGAYTFIGTAAQATTAIRQLVFDPTDNRVPVGDSETIGLGIEVEDGFASAVGDTVTTIISTNPNNAPTIGGAALNQIVNDSETILPFSVVTIADADPGTTLTISVSFDSAAKGAFTPASLAAGGFVDAGGGVYTLTGTPAEVTIAVRALVFDPADNRLAVGAAEQTSFTLTASDSIAAVVTNSGTSVNSVSVNDPTTFSGAAAGQAVNDTATVTPFSAFTFADVDPGQSLSVRITLSSPANGTFTPASLAASGFTLAAPGVYAFDGDAWAATAAIRLLSFAPAANVVAPGQTQTTTLVVSVEDGGTTPPDSTTTVVSTSINDAPAISGSAEQPALNDTLSSLPFGAVAFTDADPESTLTVTITIDSAAKGSFTTASMAATGFADAGGGVYTFTGTPLAATNAIRSLVFTPTLNRLIGGQSETVAFTITASDGIAAPISDSATQISVIGVNETPAAAAVDASLAAVRTGQTFILTAAGVADTDGTITAVRFYRDVNADGVRDEGDELLGADTDGADGWSFTATASAAWGVGTMTFLAECVDNDGQAGPAVATQVAVDVNHGALVSTVTAVPGSATTAQRVTVRATGVSSVGAPVKKVIFYEDTNGNGVWDSRDKKLGTDSKPADGYSVSFLVPKNWAVGNRMFFARADVGGKNGVGDAAGLRFRVAANTGPTITAIVANPTTLPSNRKITLTTPTVTDSDGTVKSVEYFVDSNFNGVFDSADKKIKSVSSARNGWAGKITVNRAWISSGSVRFFARAIDNNKLAGAVVALAVPVGT